MIKRHKNQKQVRLGFQLYLSHDSGKSFEMVEGFFNNREEARNYRNRKYPTLPFQVKGLRVNCEPMSGPERRT